MAGVTQCIMLSLSMVVIAAMVGAPGLGIPVLRALNTVNISQGFEAGLAIVVTAPDHLYAASEGIQLTSSAFETVIPWFKFVLLVCVVLFAFSTMISWSYYGQQAWAFVFGRGKILDLFYKLIFCFFVVIGASINLGSVIDFSDGMLFGMSIFNLIGVFLLLPVVKREFARFSKFTKHVDNGGSLDEDVTIEK